jgi:16S rRNA C967 or C1407 C5-methylase (RsmB/RsmF family)
MAQLKEHQEHVCPMDAASMAAVVALQVQSGDRVLDLCCCPGMKSLLIADALTAACSRSGSDALGSVVGVDANIDRLMVARSLVASKYKMQHAISLVCGDGRCYDPAAMMTAATASASMDPKAVEQRVKNARKFAEREKKRQREKEIVDLKHSDVSAPPSPPVPYFVLFSDAEAAALKAHKASGDASSLLFDKVLVDVECTHDGSIFHLDIPNALPASSECGNRSTTSAGGITNAHRMARMNFLGSTTIDSCRMNAAATQPPDDADQKMSSELHALQLDLLSRGFECLKPGGTLVYSTCSFSYGQNEAIVEAFLKKVHRGMTTLVCVPLVPFAPPRASPKRAVSPLLSLQSAATSQALHEVMTLTTQCVHVDLAAHRDDKCASSQQLKVEFTSARFWPHKSLTSFQFVAVLQKLS